MSTGLREQKKRQTREAISDHATRLFLERGFDKVTIAEVAAAAGVSKMTVTNYFPRKEDLALDMNEEFIAMAANTVKARDPGESALAALRRNHLAAVAEQSPVIGFAGPQFTGMLLASHALVARLREFHEQREAVLAQALAEETSAAPDDVTPRAVAAQLIAADRTLFNEILKRTMDGQSNEEIAAAVEKSAERVYDLLEPSLGRYAMKA